LEVQDKKLVCFDCGNTYIFSAEEQQAFLAKGHTHPPKRCPECRAKRAARKPDHPAEKEKIPTPSFSPASRQLYTVTCSECGKETQVPFEPRAGRPVYCSDCYRKSRASK
jgi:CxxC-x17-CxxC domain-containing protein